MSFDILIANGADPKQCKAVLDEFDNDGLDEIITFLKKNDVFKPENVAYITNKAYRRLTTTYPCQVCGVDGRERNTNSKCTVTGRPIYMYCDKCYKIADDVECHLCKSGEGC